MSTDHLPPSQLSLFWCLMIGLGVGALAGVAFALVELPRLILIPFFLVHFTIPAMAAFGLVGMLMGLLFRAGTWLVYRR